MGAFFSKLPELVTDAEKPNLQSFQAVEHYSGYTTAIDIAIPFFQKHERKLEMAIQEIKNKKEDEFFIGLSAKKISDNNTFF